MTSVYLDLAFFLPVLIFGFSGFHLCYFKQIYCLVLSALDITLFGSSWLFPLTFFLALPILLSLKANTNFDLIAIINSNILFLKMILLKYLSSQSQLIVKQFLLCVSSSTTSGLLRDFLALRSKDFVILYQLIEFIYDGRVLEMG